MVGRSCVWRYWLSPSAGIHIQVYRSCASSEAGCDGMRSMNSAANLRTAQRVLKERDLSLGRVDYLSIETENEGRKVQLDDIS